MSATVAAALKKIAVAILSDKKLRKAVLGIVLGIIIIVIMPVVAVIALFNGDINIDTDRLQQIVVEEMSDEEKAKLQAVEDMMKAIETTMTEKGFTAERTKEAQVLYTLALYDHSKTDGFVDKLVDCFAEDQTDEQLIAAVNSAFGTELKAEDYSKIMNSIRANSINTSGFTDPHSKNNLDLVEWAKQAQSHGWGYATPAIEAALSDYASRYAFPLSVPTSRGSQLRTVAHLCAEAQDTSESELTKAVCEKLKVSSKSAEALLKEYRTLCCARQLGDDVFSVSCGGDPAVAYDRLMRRTLLMQRMEEVLTPRELNLVRSYLGIGQPDEVGMTFQELAIRLNYNGPSGVEKAYKAALRKLKKDLYGGAYGRWLSAQKAINKARAEAEADPGHYTTPQTTWLDEKELMERFICEVVSLIRVHEIFSDALENIAAKIFEES